jgi:hypothetical protein
MLLKRRLPSCNGQLRVEAIEERLALILRKFRFVYCRLIAFKDGHRLLAEKVLKYLTFLSQMYLTDIIKYFKRVLKKLTFYLPPSSHPRYPQQKPIGFSQNLSNKILN